MIGAPPHVVNLPNSQPHRSRYPNITSSLIGAANIPASLLGGNVPPIIGSASVSLASMSGSLSAAAIGRSAASSLIGGTTGNASSSMIGAGVVSSTVIGPEQMQEYRCDECSKTFKTAQGLKYHNMHHTGTYIVPQLKTCDVLSMSIWLCSARWLKTRAVLSCDTDKATSPPSGAVTTTTHWSRRVC